MAINVKDSSGSVVSLKSNGTGTEATNHIIDSMASGASPDIGAVADSAVTTDTTGSLSGKLRGLVKWAFERMPTSLGQKTMAASLPIVIASDQTGVPIAAGTNSVGGFKDNGPHYTPAQQLTKNADVHTTAADITALPTSMQKIVVDDLVITVSTTAEVSIIESVSLTEVFNVFLLANTPFTLGPTDRLRAVTADNKLQVKTVAAAPVRVWCSWHSE